MRKHRIEYDSLLDALVAVAKRLHDYENRHKMASEEFFDKYTKGDQKIRRTVLNGQTTTSIT